MLYCIVCFSSTTFALVSLIIGRQLVELCVFFWRPAIDRYYIHICVFLANKLIDISLNILWSAFNGHVTLHQAGNTNMKTL